MSKINILLSLMAIGSKFILTLALAIIAAFFV